MRTDKYSDGEIMCDAYESPFGIIEIEKQIRENLPEGVQLVRFYYEVDRIPVARLRINGNDSLWQVNKVDGKAKAEISIRALKTKEELECELMSLQIKAAKESAREDAKSKRKNSYVDFYA